MNYCKMISALLIVGLMTTSLGAQTGENDKQFKEDQRKHREDKQVLSRMVSILQNKTLQKELEVVDHQLEELRTATSEFQKESAKYMADQHLAMIELQKKLKSGDREEAMLTLREIQTEMARISSRGMESVESILLPHQLDRIKQIRRQEVLKFRSGFGDEFGVAYSLADEIGLTDKEKEHLRETIESARKEYYKKLAELKSETHEKILECLPADKRGQLYELIGDRYDREDASRKMMDRFAPKPQSEIK